MASSCGNAPSKAFRSWDCCLLSAFASVIT
jgi:hypothetical protein